MRLDHQFTVPATVEEVWKAVIDPERVAPCMPGATLTEVDGDTFRGTVKVKLGPISLTYKGNGEFVEKDEGARRVVIKASGKDARGGGSAAATVTLTLTGDGGSTNGAVETDLNVTGKPAQFGRGLISEVSGKILDSFADCLSTKLGSGSAEGEPRAPQAAAGAAAAAGQPLADTPPPRPAPRPAPAQASPEEAPRNAAPQEDAPRKDTPREGGAEPIDLFDYAGGSVTKRVAPVLGVVAAVLAVVAIVRAIRK
ncbi:carbon monoxide dehydrogenase [Amycolatopsis antarctica]|uniref:Carbon monoxide dehydrogenase n=1 Tax=Amycolatopsis antarctica TaxID=1854586 RepID=A0A263CXQ4_9PSEU|nr:SRPBCC family protein [Amycolatopsis antarctica]OZM70106.1 carbon monoxide dehydrogenase [Amycolatopsis antarctica]